MADQSKIDWDLIIKVVGLVALIASGFWTLVTFRENRRVDQDHLRDADRKDSQARLQELNKYVFEKQASLYFEATEAAATIAMTHDKSSKKAATEKFYKLYFGPLVIVEDRRVELAMIEFSRCLNTDGVSCARTIPNDQRDVAFLPEKVSSFPPPTLDNLSLELAACVRSALKYDRGIDFGKLAGPISVCPYD